MRKFFFTVLLSAIVSFAFAQKKRSIADTRTAGLDTELEKILDDWKIAGFAVAVVEKNKIIYSKGFGYRDLENKTPVTPPIHFSLSGPAQKLLLRRSSAF